MGAAPSRDDTVLWKGYPTSRECNTEWAVRLQTYCNMKHHHHEHATESRNNNSNSTRTRYCSSGSRSSSPSSPSSVTTPRPHQSAPSSSSKEVSQCWQSLKPVEKMRMLQQYIKGDSKLEELLLQINNNNNDVGNTAATAGGSSSVLSLFLPSTMMASFGGSQTTAKNFTKDGSTKNDDNAKSAMERKFIDAMNRPLLPYEVNRFKHHWRWFEKAEMTFVFVEYYEVGNVGAPCTRLFTATVGRDGELLHLELPKKMK